MHIIPANLGPVASFCCKDSTKYALEGVRIEIKDEDDFIVEATDTYRLIQVHGKCIDDDGKFRSIDNEATSAVIPRESWIAAMRSGIASPLKSVGLSITSAVSKFITETSFSTVTFKSKNIEGRFPNISNCTPKSSKATFAITLDLSTLVESLRLIASLDPKSKESVILELHGKAEAGMANMVVVRRENKTINQSVVVVIMGKSKL